jgi:hypothetical protein
MPTYTEDFEGCRIVIATEPFDGPVIKGQHRLVSVTVTRDGNDLGAPWVANERKDEAEMVKQALANARAFIRNRRP